MKTTVGIRVIAFASKQLAEVYLHSLPFAKSWQTTSRDTLLANCPGALAGVREVLLFSSEDEIRSYVSDMNGFHAADYIVEVPGVA